MKEEYKPYIRWGVTVIAIFSACIMIFFFLLRLDIIVRFFGKATEAVQSIIYGLVIAFILRPVASFWQEKIEAYLHRRFPNEEEKKKKKHHIVAKGISVGIAMLIALLVIATVIGMIGPRVVDSIKNVVASSSGFLEKIEQWAYGLQDKHPELFSAGGEAYQKALEYLEDWVNTDLLGWMNTLVTGFTTYVIGFFSSLMNWVLGLIVAIYALAERESFDGQAKKMVYAFLPVENANVVIAIARKTNQVFSGFISGKLIDSLIIGVLCFVGLSVLRMPYTLLISVIVGVTNVIPFFGPYVGAVPSAFLILLVNPIQCLYFIIFILVLQQIDGNIIGPKILGDSTGLSAFWVIFSILLFGGLFGFVGMVIGVPTFAVIYYLIKSGVEYLLWKKGLPVETQEFSGLYQVDEEDHIILYQEKEKEEKKAEEQEQKENTKENLKEK
ncbi:MAG: AI-2E family transporter [Lachnospiraceae bacterium]|nr:AI-2E family transporter [Lachnospiraceae bacterium]